MRDFSLLPFNHTIYALYSVCSEILALKNVWMNQLLKKNLYLRMWQYWFWTVGVIVLISPFLWGANQAREAGPWEIPLEKRMNIRDEHLSLINPIQRGLQAQTSNCSLWLGEKVEGFPQALDDQRSIENTYNK